VPEGPPWRTALLDRPRPDGLGPKACGSKEPHLVHLDWVSHGPSDVVVAANAGPSRPHAPATVLVAASAGSGCGSKSALFRHSRGSAPWKHFDFDHVEHRQCHARSRRSPARSMRSNGRAQSSVAPRALPLDRRASGSTRQARLHGARLSGHRYRCVGSGRARGGRRRPPAWAPRRGAAGPEVARGPALVARWPNGARRRAGGPGAPRRPSG
jgi:hypothetical protein